MLQFRIDVGQEEQVWRLVGLWDPGTEGLEDVQLCFEGPRLIELVGVLPTPAEGLARTSLQPRQIDPPHL